MIYPVSNVAESFITVFEPTLIWLDPQVYSLMYLEITFLFEFLNTTFMFAFKVFEQAKMDLSVVNIASELSREFLSAFDTLYLFLPLFWSILDLAISVFRSSVLNHSLVLTD